jgi:tyrosyl-tRNA synthetase
MYQFWLNTDDADVIDRLKVFTFLTRDEIEQYQQKVEGEPFKREAQRRLALEVTELVHSRDEAVSAQDAALALFGSGDIRSLDPKTLRSALNELPNAEVSKGSLVVDALLATGLCDSKSDARRAIEQGGVSVNKTKIDSESAVLDDVLAGNQAVLARGKKSLAGLFF